MFFCLKVLILKAFLAETILFLKASEKNKKSNKYFFYIMFIGGPVNVENGEGGIQMKIIKRFSLVCLGLLIIGLQTKSVMAEENNYESNGQASFYGTYVYENEKESNDVAYTQQSEEQGRNNLVASGQAVLPKTGESENPLYSLIELVCWGSHLFN